MGKTQHLFLCRNLCSIHRVQELGYWGKAVSVVMLGGFALPKQGEEVKST